jgi:hypothetical protein
MIMASIEKRVTDNGKVSYRVKVRLKGYPTQTASFDRITDAKKWAQHTDAENQGNGALAFVIWVWWVRCLLCSDQPYRQRYAFLLQWF